ncbi:MULTISPECIES: DUF2976 domain-containing protein [Pasteurellaceae]|uniref:DUF2976 domain-containing protein n=1 Tax=Pasteurellaceae TaxID=712 RepID=UPI00021ACD84|nr:MULTISPECIES: DUF2976 domain-containing protein [Pasteurellaceae]AZI15161.1 DUF2976 domain-containing protein [Avibacterium paragallinarum]KGQ52279.1 membrane protein [Gallibacterium anatis]QIR12594.1 DUF2976 domain-containing protein [Avibacterium paragallinarum]QLD65715.1 DUF2976 domain-containing protein [Avibacterium paragallinarum]UXN34469.1 DUF2976 domain-containing protein [Avibacterium paragallinarum]
MTLFHSFFQQVKRTWQWGAQRYLAFSVLCLGAVQNALAAGPDASKIPDFKIPGVDSNTTDPMEIIWIVGKSLVTLAAVLFSAWCIYAVVRALIRTYTQATDENDKKGWGPFITALIIGFILIFFSLWLVKMAVGLF